MNCTELVMIATRVADELSDVVLQTLDRVDLQEVAPLLVAASLFLLLVLLRRLLRRRSKVLEQDQYEPRLENTVGTTVYHLPRISPAEMQDLLGLPPPGAYDELSMFSTVHSPNQLCRRATKPPLK